MVAHSAQRQRLLSQIDSAEAQIKVSQAQIYPNIVAGYQHTWAGQVSPGVDRNKAYLALQFQSGAGLSARSGMQAAASRKDATQQELETLERNLQSQARAAITELDALQAQLEPAQACWPAPPRWSTRICANTRSAAKTGSTCSMPSAKKPRPSTAMPTPDLATNSPKSD